MLYNRVIVGSAAAAWDDYAAGGGDHRAGRGASRRRAAGCARLITDRIDGFDADAIAAHLAGAGDHIKTTVEMAASAD